MKIIIQAEKPLTKDIIRNMIILLIGIIILYLMVSIYFINHFYFNTVFNSVDVSLMKYEDGYSKIDNYIKNYNLRIEDKENEINEIKGNEISLIMQRSSNGFQNIIENQKSILWISSLFNKYRYDLDDLYVYDSEDIKETVIKLPIFNKTYNVPMNPTFLYNNGRYQVVKEREGNQLDRKQAIDVIEMAIKTGSNYVNLYTEECYVKPKYTIESEEVKKAYYILNQYVKSKITYRFDTELEVLDGSTLNKWLRVDDNMKVILDETAVQNYIRQLAKKYDTVGTTRNFRNVHGKNILVSGGLYGWKINREKEIVALTENIKAGNVLETEPLYSQTAISRSKNDIGDTYIEINITEQSLWYFRNGIVYASGSIVTGNPNTGHGTVLGTNMIEYKEKNAVLRGQDYEAEVIYWMPFYGNMGLHDARWRHNFGGDIYKNRGSHGCVNLPEYLAKKIYEQIEEGTPVITYVDE